MSRHAITASSLVLTLGLPPPGPGRSPDDPAAREESALPGSRLPIVRACSYRMAGKIRPLLAFWIGRDRIGLARLVWREGEDGSRAYELLVGTDPLVAPRALNRWGYVAEGTAGTDGDLFAFMSRSDEDSLAEAEASLERSTPGGDFRVIASEVRGGRVTSRVGRLETGETPTVRDLASVLTQARSQVRVSGGREVEVAAGTRPGFLGAVAELVDRSLTLSPLRADSALPTIPYVFGGHLYDLRLESLRPAGVASPGNLSRPLLRAEFAIRNRTTGNRTRFELVYGTRGALAGVPVLIAWQPRWWLRVELHLDERPAQAGEP